MSADEGALGTAQDGDMTVLLQFCDSLGIGSCCGLPGWQQHGEGAAFSLLADDF